MPKERIIRDPLYDYISYPKDGVISDLVDTIEFQRLRWIKQLGFAHYIFPNAEHTRFSHSLGVYHLAKKFNEFLVGKEDNEDLYIAALLHDLGHLPLSHTFEKETGFKHEKFATEMIRNGETEINQVLKRHGYNPDKIADLIVNPSNPTYRHQLISSQLDVDRFDYLRRDSYFSGNPCGNFDVERVLRTVELDVEKRDLRVTEKGLASIENYLTSRYSMYYQVYLHKTKISLEEMLLGAIRRAKYLVANGKMSPETLFEKHISGDKLSLQEFIAYTDHSVIETLRKWSSSEDRTLAQFAGMIISRRPLKLVTTSAPLNYKELRALEKKAVEVLKSDGFDPDYFFIVSEQKHLESYRPYGPDKETKENAIFTTSNQDIGEKINILEGDKLQYIFVPDSLRRKIQ